MLSFQGVLLIDDNADELNQLLNAFVRAGIPCIPIKYENDNPEDSSGIAHIEVGLLTPRIIITDLNLVEATSLKASSLAAPIGKLLEKINPNGPYILIFWSKNEGLVEDVVSRLKSDWATKVNLPIHTETLSKSEFIDSPDNLKNRIKKSLRIIHSSMQYLTGKTR